MEIKELVVILCVKRGCLIFRTTMLLKHMSFVICFKVASTNFCTEFNYLSLQLSVVTYCGRMNRNECFLERLKRCQLITGVIIYVIFLYLSVFGFSVRLTI